eukprot:PhM_4_TR15151/c0_g1_i1/m.70555
MRANSTTRRPRNPNYSPAVRSTTSSSMMMSPADAFNNTSYKDTPLSTLSQDYHNKSVGHAAQHTSTTKHELHKLREEVLELTEALQSQSLQIEKERSEMRRELATEATAYRQRREAMGEVTDELRSQLEEARRSAEAHESENQRFLQERTRLYDNLKEAQETVSSLRAELAEVKQCKDVAIREAEGHKDEFMSWRKRAQTAENLVLEMKAEMTRCRGDAQSSRDMYDRLKQQFDTLTTELKHSRENEERLHQSVTEATHYLKDSNQIRKEHCELVEKCAEQSRQISTLRMEKDFLVKHMGEGIQERDKTILELRRAGQPSSSTDQFRIVVDENEKLRDSLREAMKGIEEERNSTQELMGLLKERAEKAEIQVMKLTDDTERLRHENSQLKMERVGLDEERRRAVSLRDELEKALAEVTDLRAMTR